MENDRPSTSLMVLLAASLVLAGFVYGRPLLNGQAEPDEDVLEPTDLGFIDGPSDEIEVEPWVAPENQRNPFLQVDIGTPPTETPDDLGEDESEPVDDGG